MSGFIGPELVEQIRQANDIVELIQSYIPLKRTGGTWKALCPFHNEKTPSFHVNPKGKPITALAVTRAEMSSTFSKTMKD